MNAISSLVVHPSVRTVPLKNGFRISPRNDDLILGGQQSTPSGMPFFS